MRPARISASADAPRTMPSTHLSLHCHIVFSTKERIAFISTDWRGRLHSYLGGIARGLGTTPLAIGGTADHAHVLIGLTSSHRLDYVVRDLEADSSEWIHNEIGKRSFAWQKGYGAFSVSSTDLGRVTNYLARQEEHHQRTTFQDEYLELLKSSRIEFDERYIW
jgi:REP element-mobilizing transposase RayT